MQHSTSQLEEITRTHTTIIRRLVPSLAFHHQPNQTTSLDVCTKHRGPPPWGTPDGGVEVLHPGDLLRRNHLDDNLYDAVAGLHGEVCLRVVEEHDSHRAAVVLVDHPAPSREGENLLVSSYLRRVRGRVWPLPKMIIRYNNYVQVWKIENKLKEKCIQDNNTQQLDWKQRKHLRTLPLPPVTGYIPVLHVLS